MPIFPQLDIDCPMCHKNKINKIVPPLDGTTKTKNSTTTGRNQVQISIKFHNVKESYNNKSSSSAKQSRLACNSDLIDFIPKSLLQQQLKMHLPLSVNESLHPPGAIIFVDFSYCNIENVRR